MKETISEQSFFLESEGEEDCEDEKLYENDELDGNDSDSSSFSNENENRQQSKAGSLEPSWPQSYRQSMDLYGSVPSASLNFPGPSSLSRFGSSFLSSSFARKRTPEVLPSIIKPLIVPLEADKPSRDGASCHSLLSPTLSRRSSLRRAVLDKRASAEHSASRRSTFGQAVINGMNVICGVGLLSTPYAMREGGWLGLCILMVFAVLSYYTGILLRACLDSQPGLETYPDIGQAAFGTTGRIVISIILYVELYACCAEYIILEGDNLSSLFPNAHLHVGGFDLDSPHLFALITTLAVLPTVWLRDLSVLSYISVGGVIASTLVVACLLWTGLVDGVSTHSKGSTINLSTLPVAIGLYGFCYSGHAVIPNIYSSMEKPSQFPSVLLASFGICTLMYAGAASMGYIMFGESTESQFTLNMPKDLVASKIAVWTTVVNPFTKYALTMSPVAMSLEEFLPSRHPNFQAYSIFIRTGLVISTLLVALSIPFFGLVSALIGSLLTMLVSLILPCACYLRILRGKINRFQTSICMLVITMGLVASGIGTYSALSKIIKSLN